MKITLFQASQGDCLLLTGKDGTNVLVDGGLAGSYRAHVAPTLGEMARAGQVLDLVYVSHIDQDHISGVLRMVDDLVDWKVFEFQRQNGNDRFPKPRAPRPPEIRAIWHNAFHDQVDANVGAIGDQLVAGAKTLQVDGAFAESLEVYDGLIASERQALLLSARVGQELLAIPWNQEFDGGLMYVMEPVDRFPLGTLSFSVIGPFEEDLARLRRRWNRWLAGNQEAVDTVRQKAVRDVDRLGLSEAEAVLQGTRELAAELGKRSLVTPPNLASLMILAEEDGHTVLLTGDGHGDDILDGLEVNQRLNGQGGIHVDVLKVQHHGSEHNADEEFCRRVTADHYLFCGNGAHENPDLDILRAFAKSRLGVGVARSQNSRADRPFKFWFSSSAAQVAGNELRQGHMLKVESLIRDLAAGSGGRMSFEFLTSGSKLELRL
ncbi:MAG: hypothetical protein K0U98_16400 [Deltaproteobacteria bacterium]|nr:hypothetical protein [Deltaproteobacteria bacterium]